MRRPFVAAILTFAALSAAGCKNQDQVQKDDLASLQARFDAAYERYSKACLNPLKAQDKSGVDAALGKGAPKSSAPLPKPFSSDDCKTAKAEMDGFDDQLVAARAKAATH